MFNYLYLKIKDIKKYYNNFILNFFMNLIIIFIFNLY